jgi:tetratricopeptide (TPR) repeat protein
MILRGQYAQAATLMTGLLKDRPLKDQQDIGDPFLNDLAGYDVAVEAYRCLPDKRDAFSYMLWRYRTPERVKEFARLVAEHARQLPDDPRLYTERGELHLLKGDFDSADEQFRQGMAKNPLDTSSRFGLIRARIKQGKTADIYRELGGSTQTFNDIANQCVTLKDGVALEQLLAAHRKATPAAKNLVTWDIESMFLRKDYAGTVKTIQDDRKLLKNAATRWKCEAILIRSLVRLKKSDEAVKEAQTLAQRPDTWHVLMPLALASTGDAARLLEYMETKKNNRYLVEDCYRDEDLGPLLRSDAFQLVRDRYPPPVALPNVPFLPGAPFDDDF